MNGKYYIGSSLNLTNRLNDYFQDWYYKDRNKLPIVRAILKYGMGNFALLILDFTDKENTLVKEQFWLDKLKPDYNILTLADNSAGFKHSPESIELMRQRALVRCFAAFVAFGAPQPCRSRATPKGQQRRETTQNRLERR